MNTREKRSMTRHFPHKMNEEQIRQLIRDELSNIIKIDRYVFDKKIQILDSRHIQVGKGTGTKIGTEATQKIAVYGVTPVVQANAISLEAGVGVLGHDDTARTAISSIITAIKNFGITA